MPFSEVHTDDYKLTFIRAQGIFSHNPQFHVLKLTFPKPHSSLMFYGLLAQITPLLSIIHVMYALVEHNVCHVLAF